MEGRARPCPIETAPADQHSTPKAFASRQPNAELPMGKAECLLGEVNWVKQPVATARVHHLQPGKPVQIPHRESTPD